MSWCFSLKANVFVRFTLHSFVLFLVHTSFGFRRNIADVTDASEMHGAPGCSLGHVDLPRSKSDLIIAESIVERDFFLLLGCY